MNSPLFESFSEMLTSIPARGIPKAIELERWMLEEDLRKRRALSLEDAVSILGFCRFVKAAVNGEAIFPVIAPVAHINFYKKTVMQLIEAGELPYTAQEQFDLTFPFVSSKVLV